MHYESTRAQQLYAEASARAEAQYRQFVLVADPMYRSIGRVVVAFEGFVEGLRFGIRFLIRLEGIDHRRVTDTLIGDSSAATLQQVYRSLVGDHRHLDKVEFDIVSKLFRSWQGVNEERNSVLHRAWLVLDDGSGLGRKNFQTGSGNENREATWTTADFDRFADDCMVAGMEVRHLASTFDHPNRIVHLSEAFDIVDGRIGIRQIGEVQVGFTTTRVLKRPLSTKGN